MALWLLDELHINNKSLINFCSQLDLTLLSLLFLTSTNYLYSTPVPSLTERYAATTPSLERWWQVKNDSVKLMTNKSIFAFFIAFFICLFTLSCKQTDKASWNLYGYFGSAKYFDKDNINSEYIESFIIKIDTNFVTLYGTVQTWGKRLQYNFSSNNDTLLIEKQLKIYKKDDSTILFQYSFDDSLHIEKFNSIPNLNSIIDIDGVNIEKLGQLLGNLQLVGKYKYNNQVVEFNEDGRVSNFDKFNTFKIRPRLGTFSFYDNKIIETENGIWKFSKNKETLMFQKYSTKRDDNEMYILSKDEATLNR